MSYENDSPAVVMDHEPNVEDPEGDRRHGEEVHRRDRLTVISKEGHSLRDDSCSFSISVRREIAELSSSPTLPVMCQKSADPKHAQFWGSRRLALSSLWAGLWHPD